MSEFAALSRIEFSQSQLIDQVFNQFSQAVNLPFDFDVTQDEIVFSDVAINSDVELVLFADTSMEDFVELINLLQIDQLSLVACNDRGGRASYRFKVDAIALDKKALLNDFALDAGLELALIEHAPSIDEPGLLVMDMDSTTIQIECIDEIAKLAGVGEEVSAVTERAMQGELDFAESLRARVSTLAGASEDILAQVGENLPLMPGLEILIAELHRRNWKVAVASGGFTYFTEILKHQLNLDATQANVLEIENGLLTGKVVGDITDAQVKADTLVKLAEHYQLPIAQTVAMGDGANDLLMMNAANLGVAFEAKPIVLQQASAAINTSGLDTLLHYLK
ncbi:phosphoserine phosphatase SerB [Thalassotalea sp. Y01]|uniref:phosphoserine phosphatase SerB n=1 Tax=Thalassotalea sp. Y01 TaxID=2729613 RepID=UPI00145C4F8D|nr:phosphoserine phosphatase SerB [Thalassotalea sp. Y01]NMP17395.1 phosphoserine phosphatase SerB [Thalassotalea sp. Y01]